MEQLKDLGQIYSNAAEKFNKYDGADFVLPSEFKEQVKEINSNVISYNKYSAIIMTKGNQRGALYIYICPINGSTLLLTLPISIKN